MCNIKYIILESEDVQKTLLKPKLPSLLWFIFISLVNVRWTDAWQKTGEIELLFLSTCEMQLFEYFLHGPSEHKHTTR